MNKTKIEWTDYTWNPITGCLNHINGMCKGGGFPCYAYKLANGRLKERYLANENYATTVDFRNGLYKPDANVYSDPFYPRFWPERICDPLMLTKPCKIFVCDMGELFGDWIPEEWVKDVFKTINSCNGLEYAPHTFQLLTKQPQNLVKWSFPENCWVGVTATNNQMFEDAAHYLVDIDATVKFVSIEPFLERIEIKAPDELGEILDWLIIGACTGTWEEMANLCLRYGELTLMSWGNRWTAQPKIEWVQEIVEAADKAGVPVFLKDNLIPLLNELVNKGNQPFPLRQEFPEC